jgi:hypothetical protein
MTQATEAKAKKTHVLTENQKKVLRVLSGGVPRTKDDFLAAGVTQYIKGVRALVTRKMVWDDGTHYRITGPGMAALLDADGVDAPVDAAAETQVIELAPVTHPLLDFTESPVGVASMYGKSLDGPIDPRIVTAADNIEDVVATAEPPVLDLEKALADNGRFVAFNAPAERGKSKILPADEDAECDPTRRVGVWVYHEERGLPPETKYAATVDENEGRGDTLHTTAWFDTYDEANCAGLTWAEANKYEVV